MNSIPWYVKSDTTAHVAYNFAHVAYDFAHVAYDFTYRGTQNLIE